MGRRPGYNAKLLGRLPADGNIRVPPLDVAIQRERPENHLHFCVILCAIGLFDSPSAELYNPRRCQIDLAAHSSAPSYRGVVMYLCSGRLVVTELTPISNIKPKMKIEGKVTKVELAGARVDIGAERDAFLHISELQPGRQVVTRVADVLQEGDIITVWVKQVKPQDGIVLLTRIEPPALEWSDLQRGLKLTGKIVKVEDFGLVPVSAMAKTRVEKPSDLVKDGDEIAVWITKASKKENRIGLSMVEPPAIDWSDIRVGQTYTGKVTRVENFGAFIDIGAEREGMVHVSEMETGYVSRPSDVVKMGQEVEVRVIEINPKKRQIKLTMKMDLADIEAEPEEHEEPVLTPMQLAFQAARQQNQPVTAVAKTKPAVKRDDHEDIFARTIQQHRATNG
jgi:ribosomal protein S1